MSKELAQELDPIEKEEGQEVAQETQETTQEAPKPEAEPEAKADEEKTPEKPPKGFVPQGALHEERERRKELQRNLALAQQERERERQILEARFQQIQHAIAQQNAPKPPEYDVDPLGNVKHTLDETQNELKQLREFQQQEWARQQQNFQRQQYVGQITHAVNQAEAEFAQETPDYLEAVKYFKSQRAQQLNALGYDQAQVAEIMGHEALSIADTAIRNGRSPAEVAYQMAQASGWKKPETEKPAENVQKMETLQKGTKAAQSLGSGGTPAGKLTVDAVAQMSDDEFGDFMKSGGWSKLG